MTTITVTLNDDHLLKLKQKAERLKVTPEELVVFSVKDLLSRPEDAFQRVVDYVLMKNAALYNRLAKCAN